MPRLGRTGPFCAALCLLETLAIYEPHDCRCKNQTDGLTGCCLDEESLWGLCYKKCELLTNGRFAFRTASNTCCNSAVISDCFLFGSSQSNGIGCVGYGVANDGGCAQAPCDHTEQTQDYVGKSIVGKWLNALTFRIPTVEKWGPVASIDGGNCTHLAMGSIEAIDYSADGVSEVGYRISGLRMQCQLIASQRTLIVNFGFEDSLIYLRVAVAPNRTMLPGIDFPLGKVTLTNCSVDARLSYLDFGGTNGLRPGLKALREAIIKAIHEHASTLACNQLRPVVADEASQALGDLREKVVTMLKTRPKPPPVDAEESLVDWSTYPPVLLLKALLSERANATDEVVQKLPVLDLPLDRSVHSATDAVKASLTLRSVRVEGLDTFRPQDLRLGGVGDQVHLEVSFKRLRATFFTHISVETAQDGVVFNDGPLQKQVNLSFELNNTSIAFHSLAMISRPRLDSLHVDQMQQLGCLASCMRLGRVPAGVPIRLEQAAINGTPELQLVMVGGMEGDVADAVDTTAAALLRSHLSAAEAILPGAVEALRPRIDDAVGDFLESTPECRPTGTYSGPGPIFSGILLWTATAFVAVGSFLALRLLRRPLSSIRQDSVHLVDSKPLGVSLCDHVAVPRSAFLMSMSLLAAAAVLFAYADLFLGTVINVVVTAQGQSVTVGPAFAFSLGTCIRDAVKAHAWIFALIVAGFSGAWPLLKLVLLVFSWTASGDTLSIDERERLLRFLDEYGKYSLIDTFLTIIALESYRIQWQSGAEDISVLVDPVPKMAFFTFVCASVLSLLIGHVTSHVHKLTVEWDTRSVEGLQARDHPTPVPLMDYAEWSAERRLLTVCLAVTGAALVVGAFVPSFSVSTSGVFSSLILDPVLETRTYSLYSLGASVMEGKSLSNVGSVMVQIIYFVFTLFIPLVLVAALLVLWMAPLTRTAQQLLFDLCRCLDAWASFDVFTLAVGVARFQFGKMASFLVYHDNIEPLCKWVRSNLHSECFHIECGLAPGFLLLAFAAAVSYLVPKFAFRMCEAAMEARSEAMREFDGCLDDEDDDFETSKTDDDFEVNSSSRASERGQELCGMMS